ncbi:MAG: glycosyltransferase family 2 protein, partial [Gemmatimonadota bacterium]
FSSAPEVDGSPAPSPSSARLVPQCVDGVAVVSGTDPIDERRPAHAPADVVIVNWNGRDFLPRCLEALARSTVPVRVIVVDNASQDGSVDYIRSEHPEVDVVALDENVGYAAGANVGLRHGGAPYAIVMNPDVALAPGYLERLIERCEADPRIGAAQGKLYATAPAEFIGGRLEPGGTLDSAGHSIRRSRMVVDRGQGRPDGPAYNRECSVFSACGAALLLRRSMLEDVAVDGEYFDPSFFAYKEDIDLCWRARLRGWDIRYVPTAVGHHVRSWAGPGTSPTSRPPLAARRHSWKNHYLLVIKNDRPADWLRALPWIAAWELLRQGHALLRDPKVWGAYGDLLRMIPAAWSRRRRIQGRRSVRPAAIRTWFGSTAPTVVSCETGAPIASGHLEKG